MTETVYNLQAKLNIFDPLRGLCEERAPFMPALNELNKSNELDALRFYSVTGRTVWPYLW